MNIREKQEKWEKEYLSPYASLSQNSLGRDREEPQCDIRPMYQRDRDRILHSKSFRRMKHKTQVFLAPAGDHYRTRLTHTLEVAQIARTIARALRMNEDLTEAIALGHDLGHTPFGHAGEDILDQLHPGGFKHYYQSVRVVEILEKNCKGLNLTREVRDGIMNHSTSRMPGTMEGKIVRFSDKIAYINHDIDDAVRAHIISEASLPEIYTEVLGHSSKERLNTLIHGIIRESMDQPDIRMPEAIEKAMLGLRSYMFENVYTNPIAKGQEKKAQNMLEVLYHHFLKNFHELPEEYVRMVTERGEMMESVVCDYISGMTDQYSIKIYEDLYVPFCMEGGLMFYSDDLIEEVRTRNDVVDLIGNYIKLTKKGSSYFGLCPFHNEKSPSFSVSRDKQMYYCFGCGAGGNVFTFVMEYENYTFVEAVKYLAERAGMKLPEAEVTEAEKQARNRRQKLLDIHKEAARYFYYQLKSPGGANARNYFGQRRLDSDTIARFGLGYSNPYRDDLYQFLRSKGYGDSLLKDSGLVTIDEKSGAHDKFWNRVMFPIMDVNNKVIGFGGRVLGEGTPKYLNSPETMLFDKSRNLYGLNFARTSRQSFMIICEGYMDVIAMHQAGFTNAVASLGTAFTLQHGILLKRYTEEVLLAYDSDEAGVKAILRALPILRSAGLRIRVIHMDPYKDPDEFIKNLGVDAFKERIEQAENSFMFEVSVLEKSYDLGDPDGKTRFFNAVAKKMLAFDQELERNNYIEAVARHYGISFENLQRLVNRFGLTMPEREMAEEKRPLPERTEDGAEYPEGLLASQKLLLTWLVNDTGLLKKIRPWLGPEDFVHPVYQSVCRAVYESIESTGQIIPGQIINLFQEKEEQKLVAGIFNSHIAGIEDKNSREKALTETVVRIKRHHLDEMSRKIQDLSELQKIIKLKSDLQNLHISL